MARAGFTTVRDLGGDTSAVLAVRNAVAEGRFPGPRIKVSGSPLSIVGGHADPATGLPPELAAAVDDAHLSPSVCTGVDECQKAVRRLAAAGVDVIKIMATGGVLDPGAMGLEQHFTDAEMKSIVDMAHSMHLKVAAHAHGARGILAATNAGVDSIEHGTFIDAAGAQAMKAHGTYYSGTLMAFSGVQAMMGTGKLPPESEAKARQTFAVWGKGLNLAYRSGVKIALGTDSAVAPHTAANQELSLMVTKGGMSPRDALIAATKGGPDLLGIGNETGTLDPGKSADLIAVDGDPLTDPAAVQRVGYVMVAGRPIPLR
jgi:imidazolonepropionase-like amidohydrolase